MIKRSTLGRCLQITPCKRSVTSYPLAHVYFSRKQKSGDLHSKAKKTIFACEAVDTLKGDIDVILQTYINDSNGSKKNALPQALKGWKVVQSKTRQHTEERYKTPLRGQQLLPNRLLVSQNAVDLFVAAMNSGGISAFLQLLKETYLPLTLELLPAVIYSLCKSGHLPAATSIITSTELTQNQRQYALDALLFFYCGKYSQKTQLSLHWKELLDVLDSVPVDHVLKIHPWVAALLHRRVPLQMLPQLFQILLTRRANLSDTSFTRFLVSVYQASPRSRLLLANTDKARRQVDPNAPLEFSLEVYIYMFKHLCLIKDASATAWMLENVFLKECDPVTATKLLMHRAIEIDGLGTVGSIFNALTSKGIEPDRELFELLFRAFRLNGMDGKCFEVLEMIKEKGILLSPYLCSQLLLLVKQRNGPRTVVNAFKSMYPNFKDIDSLGLHEAVGQLSNEFHVEFHMSESDIEQRDKDSYSTFGPSLNVVYDSVLSIMDDPKEIALLYAKMARVFKSTDRMDSSLVTVFGRHLVNRIGTPEAAELAQTIFEYYVKHCKPDPPGNFSKIVKERDCASILVQYYCEQLDIGSALRVLELAETANMPMSEGLIGPIVNYYKKVSSTEMINEWLGRAERCGVILDELKTQQESYGHM